MRAHPQTGCTDGGVTHNNNTTKTTTIKSAAGSTKAKPASKPAPLRWSAATRKCRNGEPIPPVEVPSAVRYEVFDSRSLVNVTGRLGATHAFDPATLTHVAGVAEELVSGDGPVWRRVEHYLTNCDHPTPASDRWATVRILELLANSPFDVRPAPAPATTSTTPRRLTVIERSLVRLTALTYPYKAPVTAALDAGLSIRAMIDVSPHDVVHHNGVPVGVNVHTNSGPGVVYWPQWATGVMTMLCRHANPNRPLFAENSHATKLRGLQSTLGMRARAIFVTAGLQHDPQVQPNSLLLPNA